MLFWKDKILIIIKKIIVATFCTEKVILFNNYKWVNLLEKIKLFFNQLSLIHL